MLVWKAISSMVLMILAISVDDCWMAFMATCIRSISEAPASAATRAWPAEVLPATALSALRLVMLESSSMEELISSSEAACSLDPSASDWLAEETCPDAVEI